MNLDNELKNIPVQKLTNEQSNILEGLITYEEATKTLKGMKNDKSPGSSGFTTEFYKIFWKEIGHFVIRSLNYGFEHGQMSITQKQGIITCLPKGDKPRQFLKNWRPITLLNTSYKIASGTIANRLKTVLPNLIDPDQTGFIMGRFMGENTRLLYDLMQVAEENNIAGLLLFIDFEKAFDSVSWDFLQNVLKFYNFGPSIQNWVKAFYNKTISSVNQGGNLSEFFNIERGCRQGDPLSPYLFILCAEILAIKLRNNKKIKGLKIVNTENKLSQFADDTAIILDGSEISLQETMKELNRFAVISGLKINYSKTQVVWIGSMKYSQNTLCTNWNLQWGKTTFTYLGIDFNTDLSKMIKTNFDKKLLEIKSLLKQWSKRNLTPIGRITVVKTLALPKLIHLFSALPNPDEKYIKQINEMFFNFIWQKPIGNVKRDTVVKDYFNGGLKMTNIKAFISSMKGVWIRRVVNNEKLKNHASTLGIDFNTLINTGIGSIEKCESECKNLFWKDVLMSWREILQKDTDGSWETFLKSPLWYNKNIQIDDKPIFYKHFSQKGIQIVNDLFNEKGEVINFQEFTEKYGLENQVLQFNGLICSVKKYSKLFTKNEHSPTFISYPYIPKNIDVFLKSKKGIKDIYRILNKNVSEPTNKKKIMEMFEVTENEIGKIYRLPFIITQNSRLQWFQYKINHLILTTNSFLSKINLVPSPLCTFCKEQPESITHLLWECEKVQNLLESIDTWIVDEGSFSMNFNKRTFLFGIFNNNYATVQNLVILTIKYYIYCSRCLNRMLSLQGAKQAIKNLYDTEKLIAAKKQKLEKFNEVWNNLNLLIQNNGPAS